MLVLCFYPWQLDACGRGIIDKEKNITMFEDIPTELTGIACMMDHTGRLFPCSEMFTVGKDSLKYINPSADKTDLFLLRKFPVKEKLQDFSYKIIGTKIQGANKPDFSDTVTLFTIKDIMEMNFQDIVFKNSSKYRYYRLFAKDVTLMLQSWSL